MKPRRTFSAGIISAEDFANSKQQLLQQHATTNARSSSSPPGPAAPSSPSNPSVGSCGARNHLSGGFAAASSSATRNLKQEGVKNHLRGGYAAAASSSSNNLGLLGAQNHLSGGFAEAASHAVNRDEDSDEDILSTGFGQISHKRVAPKRVPGSTRRPLSPSSFNLSPGGGLSGGVAPFSDRKPDAGPKRKGRGRRRSAPVPSKSSCAGPFHRGRHCHPPHSGTFLLVLSHFRKLGKI